MFLGTVGADVLQMTVIEIINVIAMPNGCVATARPMDVRTCAGRLIAGWHWRFLSSRLRRHTWPPPHRGSGDGVAPATRGRCKCIRLIQPSTRLTRLGNHSIQMSASVSRALSGSFGKDHAHPLLRPMHSAATGRDIKRADVITAVYLTVIMSGHDSIARSPNKSAKPVFLSPQAFNNNARSLTAH